ncbi:MAG: amidohydrolase family protein [Gammaproteobacteria bacterium]|nr:amidohydrolase family protein [Gammaproteobacteria bacterium]
MTDSPIEQAARHEQWLASLEEPILEPALPIVDPHHHLWIRNGVPYLLPELLGDLNSGHKVLATVFAECHSMYKADGEESLRSLGETEFVTGVAAMSESGGYGAARACAVMFGRVDLTLGAAVEPILEAHLRASGGRFRGVRYSTGWDASERIRNVAPRARMLREPAVREALGVLSRMGLSFDSWLYHPQLDDVIETAREFPELTIILNHVGSPILGGPYRDRRDEVFRIWKSVIGEVASCPNVVMKLGALPIRMPGSDADRSMPPGSEEVADAWRPWLERCIEVFGASRCMFESNFPVQRAWCSYPVVWNAFKRIAAGATPTEKLDLFQGTAQRAYRIPLAES